MIIWQRGEADGEGQNECAVVVLGMVSTAGTHFLTAVMVDNSALDKNAIEMAMR